MVHAWVHGSSSRIGDHAGSTANGPHSGHHHSCPRGRGAGKIHSGHMLLKQELLLLDPLLLHGQVLLLLRWRHLLEHCMSRRH
jgi:hypothetical protein